MRTQLDLDNIFGGNSPFGIVEVAGSCASGIDAIMIYGRSIVLILAVIVVLAAIVTMAFMAIKLITAAGNGDQFGEGFAGVRNVLLGLIFTFVVLLLIYIIFNTLGPDPALYNC